ncbi:hypothetical protein C5S53_02355 [Methanophagales archaeon]|nr:hypothetical protein C5S53_02355 [Methanophagales archaeon]
MREEVKSDDTVYCGLALFIITLNPDVIIELRKMETQDETLRELIELSLMKLQNEDISEDIAAFDREDVREEMKNLLGLLKSF